MGRRWIGRWMIAVSALHTLFGIMAFAPVLRSLVASGVWNSVGADPMRGAVAWFLLCGGFMLIGGLAVDACERSEHDVALASTGWSLLAVTAITIILMPVSGAWLLLPPAVAMIRRKARPA